MCKAYCVVLHFFNRTIISRTYWSIVILPWGSFNQDRLQFHNDLSGGRICPYYVDSGYVPPTHLNPEYGPPVGVTSGHAPPICMKPRYTLPVPLLVNSASARILYRHGHYGWKYLIWCPEENCPADNMLVIILEDMYK